MNVEPVLNPDLDFTTAQYNSFKLADLKRPFEPTHYLKFYNHGEAAIAEARLAKERTYPDNAAVIDEFYTVGVDMPKKDWQAGDPGTAEEFYGEEEMAKKVIEEIATNGNSYMISSDDIEEVLKDIGKKIISKYEDCIVKDPMGEGFEVVSYAQPDVGSASQEGQTLTWKIGEAKDNQGEGLMIATFKYIVKATDDVADALDKDGFAPTNGLTLLTYEKDGESREKEFAVPKVQPIAISLKKELFDENGTQVKDSEKEFSVEITGDGLTDSVKRTLTPKDGEIQIFHPWKEGTNYTITEKLGQEDVYSTTIIINGTSTSGTSGIFSFVKGSENYQKQTIVIRNSEALEKLLKLHVRQAIRQGSIELVIPSRGFFTAETAAGKNRFALTSPSAKESAPVTQSMFTAYEPMLEKGDLKMELKAIVPEYYSIYGYILTDEANELGTHVSDNAMLQKAPSLQLDYGTAEEYWVTVFLDASQKTPGMYNWDYRLNDFGKIRK